jgi:RNase P/RNase MRP subunit POP5
VRLSAKQVMLAIIMRAKALLGHSVKSADCKPNLIYLYFPRCTAVMRNKGHLLNW